MDEKKHGNDPNEKLSPEKAKELVKNEPKLILYSNAISFAASGADAYIDFKLTSIEFKDPANAPIQVRIYMPEKLASNMADIITKRTKHSESKEII